MKIVNKEEYVREKEDILVIENIVGIRIKKGRSIRLKKKEKIQIENEKTSTRKERRRNIMLRSGKKNSKIWNRKLEETRIKREDQKQKEKKLSQIFTIEEKSNETERMKCRTKRKQGTN